MPQERATALIIRASDFSETSRVVTLWTRELGKARALAKGGRRLKSNFDVALDLLTVCGIVLLRKSSGNLDLLTEARVEERFPALTQDLSALYAAYYIAEMLSDWTQDHDPHPSLFDEVVATLRNLGQPGILTGPCLAHFELVLLRELGYGPALDFCADCGETFSSPLPLGDGGSLRLAFSAAGGGVLCETCQAKQRDRRALNEDTWRALVTMQNAGEGWRDVHDPRLRGEVRQLLNDYVTYQLGRRPRLLPYLGS
ncbi:MAG: DNA repair protein RecO [Planctomycetes bacterium]|nr:DNA repair protein RecO [Planctomycetota bacterium]